MPKFKVRVTEVSEFEVQAEDYEDAQEVAVDTNWFDNQSYFEMDIQEVDE